MKAWNARTEKLAVAASSLANTIRDIGINMWSGLALSGKTLNLFSR